MADLLVARVAVHFNAVCEQFSPYDTILEIESAETLTDHKLSAACSLHTASGSVSSVGSSPKKRLVEIAEEEEDEVPPTKRKSVVAEPQTPKSPKWTAEPVTLNAELAASPEQSKFAAPSTSEVPTFVGASDSRPDTAESYSAADAAATQDFGYTGYAFSKPKVKLAPRPSVEGATRPQTAGNFRPVSAIPAGYKLFGKGRRTKSKDSNTTISPQEEVAEFAPSPTDETERPVSSSSTVGPEGTTTKKISPEKARLMKAMKLREKKKAAAAAAAAATTTEGEAEAEDAEADGSAETEVETETETVADEVESPTTTTDSIHVTDAMSSSTHTEASEVASEPDQSTNASSVSESTDETARAKDELAEEQDRDAEAVVDTEKQPEAPKEASDQGKAEEQEPIAIPLSKFSSSISSTEPEAAPEPTAEVAEAAEQEQPAALVASPEAIRAATMAAAEPVVSTPAVELAKSPLMLSSEITEPKAAPEADVKPVVATEATTEAPQQPADAPEPAVEAQEAVAETATTAATEPTQPKDKEVESDAETVAPTEQQKRAAVVEPIQTAPVAALAPAADVKSSSPTEPPTTRAQGAEATSYTVRTVSDPVRGKFVSDNDVSKSSARSLTTGAAYLHKITQQQQNNNLSLKSNVGSSISQRIKALEKLSSVPDGDVRPVSRERPQTAFFSVKKKELKAPSVLERANSLRATTPSPGDSPETTRPLLDRSNMSNRLSVFQPFMDPVSPGKETISVTAKIVRDPMPSTDAMSDPSAFNPLDLKESPLMVSHQKATQDKTSPPETPLEQSGSQDSLKENRSRRTSLSIVRGLMKDKKSPTSGSEEFQAPGSPSQQRPAMSTNSSFNARSPSSENINAGDDKSPDGKMSRAGRFMKRLSTLSGGVSRTKSTSGSTTTSTPLAPAAEEGAVSGQQQQIVSYLGDVNVQFPDSLLWKRRNLCLDAQGFLVMSALPSQSSRAAQGTKRFHMSEFRAPYIPEVEMQELPNSVVVDFVEGTSLQLACEDRHGQMEVLSSTFLSFLSLFVS